MCWFSVWFGLPKTSWPGSKNSVSRSREWKLLVLLQPGFKISRMSLLSHFIGQSQSRGQPCFKERGEKSGFSLWGRYEDKKRVGIVGEHRVVKEPGKTYCTPSVVHGAPSWVLQLQEKKAPLSLVVTRMLTHVLSDNKGPPLQKLQILLPRSWRIQVIKKNKNND